MPEASDDEHNIDKVRELLFGSQMRENEQRFARLEEQLVREVGRVAASLEARLDSTEESLRQALEQQGRQQKQERSTQLDAGLQALKKEFSGQLTSQADLFQKRLAEIQQQLHDQGTLMQERLQEQQARFQQALEMERGRLETAKVGRRDLAVMFEQISRRLGDDTDSNGAESGPESGAIPGG